MFCQNSSLQAVRDTPIACINFEFSRFLHAPTRVHRGLQVLQSKVSPIHGVSGAMALLFDPIHG